MKIIIVPTVGNGFVVITRLGAFERRHGCFTIGELIHKLIFTEADFTIELR